MAHEIFISYASEDALIANQMCEIIETQGLSCWMAPRDIPSGADYPKSIIRAIKNSQLVVLVFSSNSMSSNHVTSEILSAFNKGLPIIAVRVEDIEPNEQMEYLLSTKNWLDALSGVTEENGRRLLDGIKKLLAERKSGNLTVQSGAVKSTISKPVRRESRSLAIYIGAILIFFMTLAVLSDDLRGIMITNLWIPLLIVLVPVLIIIPDAIGHINRYRRKKKIEEVGISGRIRDPEYFRTYPYETIPDYMKEFRADKAHEKAFKWIARSTEPLLFFSGQSGTGKTSILQAYVSPMLQKQDPAVMTITIRSFDNPLKDLRNELLRLSIVDTFTAQKDLDIRALLAKAVSNAAPGRLLIIFDQFEELLILQDRSPDRLEEMNDLLSSLCDDPIPGLTFLLSFRSDYLPLLENFDLPNLTIRKNWFEVGAFTESAAREFLKGSNIMFSDSALRDLFEQIAAFEGTKGLVRPIILNMVGMIVQKSGETQSDARQKKTENLMAEYLRYNLYRREMKDHAPDILEQMVTALGTTVPRTIGHLMLSTGIPKNEIKGTLNLLANAGLVRQIDQKDDVWEVAHDFIAQNLLMVLRGTRKSLKDIVSPWLAPASLCLWGIVILFLLPPFISNLPENSFFDKIANLNIMRKPSPAPVEEVIEEPVEIRIPVELQIEIEPSVGYKIASMVITPPDIAVDGDEEIINALKAIKTEFLFLGEINQDISIDVQLISPGSEITIEPETVNLNIDIEPFAEETAVQLIDVADIPVELSGESDELEYVIKPDLLSIQIEIPDEQVEGFDSTSLSSVLDVSSYADGTHLIASIPPELPEEINIMSITPEQIELIISKKPEPVKPPKPVEKPKEEGKPKPSEIEPKPEPRPVESSTAKGLFDTAMGKFDKGLYDDTIGILKKAVAKDPNYKSAWYYIGLTYFKKAQEGTSYTKLKKEELYKSAVASFTKVIQLSSNDRMAYLYRGRAYMELGKNLQAPIDDFKKYTQLDPRNKQGYYYLGMAYNAKYEWVNAIEAFKKSLQFDSNYKSAQAGLWTAYKFSGNFDDAVSTYTNMIKKRSSKAAGYYYLGLTYEEKGDHGKAVENIKKALEIYPSYTDARIWLIKAKEPL
ncbi:TIR domain-containing protein [bacterium]|nr:TIR domain-containing protein [bacterium]